MTMDRQFLIREVDERIFIFPVAKDPNFQVVRGRDPGGAAKELIHSDMRVDSFLLSWYGRPAHSKQYMLKSSVATNR